MGSSLILNLQRKKLTFNPKNLLNYFDKPIDLLTYLDLGSLVFSLQIKSEASAWNGVGLEHRLLSLKLSLRVFSSRVRALTHDSGRRIT